MTTESGIKLSNTKVLIIDSKKSIRESLNKYLSSTGFDVVTARNGEEGMQIFNMEHPDIVITDLQMANMGGLEVLASIHKISTDIPVIIIAANDNRDDIIYSLRLGAWDYLTKPIDDLESLEHSIRKAIEHSRLLEKNKFYLKKLEHNLQILEEDEKAGRSIQMCLLPEHNVQFGDYLFDHHVSPSLYLNGDFLEYFAITENKVGLYLADVSGHGVASAFVTVFLKKIVEQSYANFQLYDDQTILMPDKMMGKISDEIHAAKLGKYMTMVYGVIDLVTNELVYGVAGHYPNPVLLQKDRTAEYLPGRGFPVGILENATYKAEKIIIPEGGHLVIMTDGIVELFLQDKSMEIKDAVLLNIIEYNNANIPLILRDVGLEQKVEHQPDDITILTMSRLNSSS